MNKTVKRILVSLAITIGLILLIAGGFFYKFRSETSVMTPVQTGKITDDIFAIKDGFVNMYLVKDSNDYIAIDAGKDSKVVESELKKCGIDLQKVTAVLLTHTDMDHVAALSLFSNAKIFLAKEEVKMINGEKHKVPMVSNQISRSDYQLLEDQQTLTIGRIKIFCILTSGHTTGSLCFQVNDKYLFTGDILSLKNGKVSTSVKFFDLDHDMADKSISRVTSLPGVQYILTSHFGITADYPAAVKDWKE